MNLARIICLLTSVALIGKVFFPQAYAEPLSVAVASNFTLPMKVLAKEFEKQSGHKLRVSFGSSGKFYAQIKHGAPFQVFLSADQAKPSALEKEGWGVSGSRFTYATGRLALWSSKENFIDEQLSTLKSGQFNKLALANPKLAPYGMAAVQVLDNLKLTQASQHKWVKGENIAQTYQFVSTGNSDLGFVALSQIINLDKTLNTNNIKHGSAWIIPSDLHQAIHQDAILLKRGKDSQAAQQFITFIKTPKAKNMINHYGYQTL